MFPKYRGVHFLLSLNAQVCKTQQIENRIIIHKFRIFESRIHIDISSFINAMHNITIPA